MRWMPQSAFTAASHGCSRASGAANYPGTLFALECEIVAAALSLAFRDTACVAFRLFQVVYRPLFEPVWRTRSISGFRLTPRRPAPLPEGRRCSTAVPCQIALSAEDRGKANNAYDNWGQSISKHERSPRISAFSTKFDAFLAGSYPPTADAMTGYNLFKGKCKGKGKG